MIVIIDIKFDKMYHGFEPAVQCTFQHWALQLIIMDDETVYLFVCTRVVREITFQLGDRTQDL